MGAMLQDRTHIPCLLLWTVVFDNPWLLLSEPASDSDSMQHAPADNLCEASAPAAMEQIQASLTRNRARAGWIDGAKSDFEFETKRDSSDASSLTQNSKTTSAQSQGLSEGALTMDEDPAMLVYQTSDENWAISTGT